MFIQTASIIITSATMTILPINEKVFYLDSDYTDAANEYMIQNNSSTDENITQEILYQMMIKELLEEETAQ